jgi:ribosomal protein L11 methylase PrmA
MTDRSTSGRRDEFLGDVVFWVLRDWPWKTVALVLATILYLFIRARIRNVETVVVPLDIDPQALIATRDNAARNDVGDKLAVTGDPALDEHSADLLLANILAGPLVELAPRFARALRPGGQLALSGLLTDQADTVTAAYRPWFDIGTTATRDGWVLLAGQRRAD